MKEFDKIEKQITDILKRGYLSYPERKSIKQFLEKWRIINKALNVASNSIFITDRDGNIIWVNNAFCSVTGFSEKEIIGKNPRILKSGKQDQKFYKQMWDTILRGKVWRGEIINKNKYGELYIENVSITPVTNNFNEVTNFITVLENVTYVKELEKNLKVKAKTLATYFSVSDLIFMEVDNQGRILAINPKGCKTFDYTAEELVGETWLKIVVPSEKKNAESLLHGLKKFSSSKSFEHNVITKNGERKTILWNVAAVIENEEIPKLIFAGEDVTEKRIEEKVFEALSQRKSFEALQDVMKILKDVILFEEATLLVSTREKKYIEFPQYVSPKVINKKSILNIHSDKGSLIENGELIEQSIINQDFLYIPDIEKSPLRCDNHTVQYIWRSRLLLPLIVSEKFKVILSMSSQNVDAFRTQHINILKRLRNVMAVTVEKWYLDLEVEKLTIFEPLTTFANRKHFLKRLKDEIAISKRREEPLSLVMVEVSDLAYIEGKQKHNTGPEVSKKILAKARKKLRESDLMFVTAGSEFLILLTDSSIEDARNFTKRLLDSAKPIFKKEKNVVLNAGIAQLENDDEDGFLLLKKARLALYKAKIQKEAIHVHSLKAEKQLEEHTTFNNKMRAALENEEFILYFQPVVDLKTSEISSAEALIRWKHDGKILFPNFFIPFAEESGFITQIDEWVLKTACEHIRFWKNKGFVVPISINVSAPTMRRENFVTDVQDTLSRNNVMPNEINFELLERVTMSGKEVEKNIKELSSMGVHISLDDFGTGYSSMNYLMIFPIDTLKIDKSFVQNMIEDEKYELSIQIMISLGKRLGLRVVAEGVENKKQVRLLKRLGCDAVQGYYFSKPVSAPEFEKILMYGTSIRV